MAKKKTAKKRAATKANESQDVDRDPKVVNAAERLQQAREALRQAEVAYTEVRERAADKAREWRQATVGELIDETVDLIKKYPAASVVAASAIGFILGRLFRR